MKKNAKGKAPPRKSSKLESDEEDEDKELVTKVLRRPKASRLKEVIESRKRKGRRQRKQEAGSSQEEENEDEKEEDEEEEDSELKKPAKKSPKKAALTNELPNPNSQQTDEHGPSEGFKRSLRLQHMKETNLEKVRLRLISFFYPYVVIDSVIY